MFNVLILSHVGATLFMLGVIWFVHIVHYPLFNKVGLKEFCLYESLHRKKTTFVVAAPMLVELMTGGLLFIFSPTRNFTFLLVGGMGLILLNWISTWCIQVPDHVALAKSINYETYSHLVRWNWVRTISWSIRGILCLGLLFETIR